MIIDKKLLIDKRSIMQVLGGLMLNTNLLNRTDKYIFNEEDFGDTFYISIYGAINNLKVNGLKKVSSIDIDNYLSSRPQLYKIFTERQGLEQTSEFEKIAEIGQFDSYYQRMKKFTLLRMYNNHGIEIDWLYDPSTLDLKKKESQEDWLDTSDISEIALSIDNKINEIKSRYLNSIKPGGFKAGENIFELIDKLKKTPEVGIPLYGSLINTITRGARLKKFYLISAPSGVGKSRNMIANACNFSCNEIYDIYKQSWVKNGTSEPTLYISTEQELDEIQTMMLAFLSSVDEEKILKGDYTEDEEERVLYAAGIIQKSPIYVELLPDFSLSDVENTIRKHVIDNGVKYVAHDYIHTSLKILEEISKKSGVKLREDNVLYMLAIRLKDLCNELGVFILSSTQLNGK